MGGYGSSRWGSTVTRMTTEGLPRLDVRVLAREGCLIGGTLATIAWHCGDSVWATITTQVHADEPDALILEYNTLRSSGSWMPIQERIGLDTTSCHFGGERSWLMCPGCGQRRAVLFAVSGRFRCRGCHQLAYSSTREDAVGQSNRWLTMQRTTLLGSA